MALICGIDEAGRGPLIGPLVIAGVLIEEKDNEIFRTIGVKDSKQILPTTRARLFGQIKSIVKKYEIIQVSPAEIDTAVLSKTTNLNWLEAEKSAEIIAKLEPDIAILDCPSNNTAAYKNYVSGELRKKGITKIKLIVEHKADQNYPSSAAASILAKVTRDEEIEKLKKKVKHDFGSGYPSDPKTQKFLRENYKEFRDIFRKSWSSVQQLYAAKSQTKLGSF